MITVKFNSVAFCIFLILLIYVDNAFAWRNFWKGRDNGGNLGNTKTHRHLNQRLHANIDLEKDIPDHWLNQNLDHFDPTNTVTWKQRYFVNKDYYKTNGTIFLMIGGEGEASKKFMTDGAWIEFAKEHNALCFQLEHRYYGDSHPTSDLSTENLQYLSSEQALADLAYFITSMNELYGITQRWIAFGGSYSGSLAAWLREKYPHLVHGAISSSGPLLAKADFTEYFDVVTRSLGTHSDKCVYSVQKSFAQVDILMRHMIGQKSLDEKFKLCDPMEEAVKNQLDVWNFYESLADNFAGVVQYNKDNRVGGDITIDTICDIMVNTSIGTPVDRLAEVNKLLLKEEGSECLDYKYDGLITSMSNTSWSSDMALGGMRQWTYQTCTEFGFYQTAENENNVFGNHFPLSFFIKQCGDIYGEKFTSQFLDKSIKRTNIYYGALHPDTTNVIYIHGSIDPWHALGLTTTINPNMPTIFIEGTAHCADMYASQTDDMPQLVAARKKIRAYLSKILKA